MLDKPETCKGCPLYKKGTGFSQPFGTGQRGVLLLGEALGANEAIEGVPFVGMAGHQITGAMARAGWKKGDFSWWNVIACQPPQNWLEGAPWEYAATAHCRQYLRAVVSDYRPKVIVPMGNIPTKAILNRTGISSLRGYCYDAAMFMPDGTEHPFYVVPTFHPSYIMKGNHNLTTVQLADLSKAVRLANEGETRIPTYYITDGETSAFTPGFFQEARHASHLACDIETEQSAAKSEEDYDDIAESHITRVSFSFKPGYAITIQTTPSGIVWIKKLIQETIGHLIFWNSNFDVPRLIAHQLMRPEDAERQLDAMWMWHFLQSDLPKGLGFVSSLLTDLREWKSLSDSMPEHYSCVDADATIRNFIAIDKALRAEGRYHAFAHHEFHLRPILQRMGQSGILSDERQRALLRDRLDAELDALERAIQPRIPEEALPKTLYKVNKVRQPCWRCSGSGKDPSPEAMKEFKWKLKHLKENPMLRDSIPDSLETCKNCNGEGSVGALVKPSAYAQGSVVNGMKRDGAHWVKYDPFLPTSSQQVQDYIRAKGYRMPVHHKTKQPTTGEAEIERLAKQYTKDTTFQLILKYRFLTKQRGTYIDGYKPGPDGRVRTLFTQNPSTLRLASRDPNVQNIPNPKRFTDPDQKRLAKEIRDLYMAADGNLLLAVDYSGIEAVLAGWYARDPDYIQSCRLGIHAILASHILVNKGILSEPINVDNAESARSDIRRIKKDYPEDYARSKVVTHGSTFGATPYLIYATNRDAFKTPKDAQEIQELFFQTLGRKLHLWQWETLRTAHEQTYLQNAFGYRHYFWKPFEFRILSRSDYFLSVAEALQSAITNVREKTPFTQRMWVKAGGTTAEITWSDDSRRCLGFLPQSTAAAIMKDAVLSFGAASSPIKDWIRWSIHDELIFEIPESEFVWAANHIIKTMKAPIPWLDGLHIDVEASYGTHWGSLEELEFA